MTRASVFAVTVTYNRKTLLERCLSAQRAQTLCPDKFLIVDNSSTDGTGEWLPSWLQANLPNAVSISLPENMGGAGGFSAGLHAAVAAGAQWVWMMDDDAEPHADALHELMQWADNPSNIYGSLAVNGDDTAWPTTLLDEKKTVLRAEDVPQRARVQSLPFLGILIHRRMMEKIGLPDAGFFIAADDVEYCVRAQRAGADIIVAGKSRIEHPKVRQFHIDLFGRKIPYLSLPPWKRFYDTRNRILIARKYYGFRLLTQTIPGSLMRIAVALLREPDKLTQLWAFTAGFIDGMLGISGKRHQKWGIPR